MPEWHILYNSAFGSCSKIFNCPISTPVESYYLETATKPIRFVLMGRRLMYLWNILQKSDKELVRQVYKSQTQFSVKNDWVLQVKDDLIKCNIELLDDEIASMKKEKFKKLVNSRIEYLSIEYFAS